MELRRRELFTTIRTEGAILPPWPEGPPGPLQLDVYPARPAATAHLGDSQFVLYEDDGGSRWDNFEVFTN